MVRFLASSLLCVACATSSAVGPEAKEVASKGSLRAAINYGNAVLAQKDPTTG